MWGRGKVRVRNLEDRREGGKGNFDGTREK